MPPRKNEPPEAIRPALSGRMVSIDDLTTLPGNPRRGDIERIKASLIRFGQRYPSVVRGNVLLAGNNRLQAMRELGWTHVAVVDADDLTEAEAEAFALADNRTSDLATYDAGELALMVDKLDDDLRDVLGYLDDELADFSEFLGHDFDLSGAHAPNLGPDEDNTGYEYTKKIVAPIYEPKGEKPAVEELYDSSYTVELQTEILQSPDLTADERVFLLAAAERHTVFKFDRVADFYAHSSPGVQRLMERSAMVIIDFDKAIEAGFVQMSFEIARQYVADRVDHAAGQEGAIDEPEE